MPCLFCEIVGGRIPSKKAYEDEQLVAFYDVKPQAPIHVLLIPRKHITSLLDVAIDDDPLIGALVRKARDIAAELGLSERGFRLIFNCGEDSGYSVYHVHLHLVGGRRLSWPPG